MDTRRLGDFTEVPVIDVTPLVQGETDLKEVANQIGAACRESGFFYIIGHGVDEGLRTRLEHLSREFFAIDPKEKSRIAMARGGRAWRGYFSVGEELTSGKPDVKEGLYFGRELAPEHPLVRAGTPMHGPNLFPDIPLFRETVLAYIDALTTVGHHLIRGISLSLGLPQDYFAERYTADPLVLFRIFNYPAIRNTADQVVSWGVGEHTDYGLLTILWQDASGGLQVKSRSNWIDAPPIPCSFICNIGDMLDRLTRGLYRSTPHRVRNRANRDRLSFPFFFDPNFFSEVHPIQELSSLPIPDDRADRWDRASVHAISGTYGDYILNKVSNVFPQLRREVIS